MCPQGQVRGRKGQAPTAAAQSHHSTQKSARAEPSFVPGEAGACRRAQPGGGRSPRTPGPPSCSLPLASPCPPCPAELPRGAPSAPRAGTQHSQQPPEPPEPPRGCRLSVLLPAAWTGSTFGFLLHAVKEIQVLPSSSGKGSSAVPRARSCAVSSGRSPPRGCGVAARSVGWFCSPEPLTLRCHFLFSFLEWKSNQTKQRTCPRQVEQNQEILSSRIIHGCDRLGGRA